jgi:hypothetical protein
MASGIASTSGNTYTDHKHLKRLKAKKYFCFNGPASSKNIPIVFSEFQSEMFNH